MTPGERRGRLKVLLLLHLLLMLFSVSGIMSKIAAQYDFLSLGFILAYGGMVAILGVYALGWQQVIKRLPLTTAYANRAVTIVWGIIWGALLFHEQITAPKLVGAAVVLAGVALFAVADNEGTDAAGADAAAGKPQTGGPTDGGDAQ